MKKVLVTASTFPRWKNDSTPGFVYELSKLISKKYPIEVLVPHYPSSKKKEKIGKLNITRFRYFFPEKKQKLCYNGGILPNLKKSTLAKIQVPLLLISEFFSMIKIIKKEKIRLIHAHWILPQGLLGAIIKKIFKIPLIITVHAGDIFPLKNKMFRKIAKYSLEKCDICTVNSSATKKEVLKLTKKINQIKIIPMGVDLKTFSPLKKYKKLKEKLGVKGPLIMSVGRLAEKKGFKYLIKSMPFVLKKYPQSKLIIIGSGPEEKELKKQATKNNAEESIIFTGEIKNKDLPSYYASSDLFVLPSIVTDSGDTEGLGVVLLEAIASGTPVIASKVGGIPDIVKHEHTGLLVNEKDPEELAKAIIRKLSDKELRQKHITNAQKHVIENYSWEKVSGKFIREYRYLIDA